MGIFEHSIFMPIIASLMFTVSLFSFLVVFHYSRKNFRLNHLKGEIVLNGKILDFNLLSIDYKSNIWFFWRRIDNWSLRILVKVVVIT